MLKLVFVAQSILSVGLFPVMAQASILSVFGLGEAQAQSNKAEVVMNSQTLVLPQASVAAPQTKIDQEEIITVSNDALMAQAGPLGTQADVADNDVPETADIYTYVVKSGDTLAVIAKIFKVSVGTIVWTIDLSDNKS